VHVVSVASLLLEVANGVTTVRNMGGGPLHLAWRQQIALGKRLGPTLYTAGPILYGRKRALDAADAAAEVAAQRRAGYDFIKVYNGLGRASFDATLDAARREGMRVVGHVPDEAGLAHALAAGQASIEHLDGYARAVEADDSPVRGKKGLAAWLQRPFHASSEKVREIAARPAAAGG